MRNTAHLKEPKTQYKTGNFHRLQSEVRRNTRFMQTAWFYCKRLADCKDDAGRKYK